MSARSSRKVKRALAFRHAKTIGPGDKDSLGCGVVAGWDDVVEQQSAAHRPRAVGGSKASSSANRFLCVAGLKLDMRGRAAI